MLNLAGRLPVEKVYQVSQYTMLRFANASLLETPEAFALYENRMMPNEEIKWLCEEHYGIPLYEPQPSYVPRKIVEMFEGLDAVPVVYIPSEERVIAVYLPEVKPKMLSSCVPFQIDWRPTTIYYYLQNWQRSFGRSPLLKEVPVKVLFDLVVSEAITVGASDITISNADKSVGVYYNVRKKKVESHLVFHEEFMSDLVKLLTVRSPIITGSRSPKYVDIRLNKEYRARVLINCKYNGYAITIRLLPDKAFDTSVHCLNLTDKAAEWLLNNFLDNTPGLRLIVGATMSGKNTTSLSLLREIVKCNRYKVVSIEMPVEQELPGVEQINTDGVEEYTESIKSLIHQNPDFVYITEIRDVTALPTVQITNTGKCVMSTLHSNSVADTLSRLIDITGLSQDRIVQTLHSVCYQELVRDEEHDTIYPRCRYVRFTNDLKYRLYGKSLGEAIKTIMEAEEGDEWTSTVLTWR